MDFFIDLIMKGKFPSGEDHDKWIVTKKTFDKIQELLTSEGYDGCCFRMRD